MGSTQKEAVFSAIQTVLANANIIVPSGSNHAPLLTRELRAQVTQMLVDGFTTQQIQLSTTFDSDKKLRAYCSGLISNWLRKDARLSGTQSSVNPPQAQTAHISETATL